MNIINDILAYCDINITEDILKYLLTVPRFVLDDLDKDETIKILKDFEFSKNRFVKIIIQIFNTISNV